MTPPIWRGTCESCGLGAEITAGQSVREKKVIGYLRVSTIEQDLEKFKAGILGYANAKGLIGQVEFVEEKISGLEPWRKRKLNEVAEGLMAGDVLVVPELSRLGRWWRFWKC
jgi:DNA invertase Pin-like site-specific DNA recombinase